MNERTDIHIGLATGMYVRGAVGAGYEKQVNVENASNRHTIVCFDHEKMSTHWRKIKRRIEHVGQRLVEIRYKKDAHLGTEYQRFQSILVVAEHQEVFAADGRDMPARWIKAKDLIPQKHFLKLASKNPSHFWAEVVFAAPAERKEYCNAAVHELVLVDGESFASGGVLCRTTSVKGEPLPRKRLVYPLKDYPIINFVPQPKTLAMAQAEIWYRMSVTLLPRCVEGRGNDIERLRKALELKLLLRDVAAKAMIESKLRGEFLTDHPIPELQSLLEQENYHSTAGQTSFEVENVIASLALPGDRRYSEFCGGMESHRVWSEAGHWEFDGAQWVISPKSSK